MKTAVFFGLFVLVACLQLEANGAEINKAAKCELEINGYVQTCDDVTSSMPKCPEGWVLDWLEEDLSKPFPECCGRWYCREIDPQ